MGCKPSPNHDHLYSVSDIRKLEQQAIAQGIPETTLMERAGEGAFQALRRYYPKAHSLAILCGGGNNGGDAYVLARLAHQANLKPSLYSVGSLDKLPSAAKQAAQSCIDAGLTIETFNPKRALKADVIVDGILGIGAHDKVREPALAAIEAINRANISTMSLDIPSGIDADTGQILGTAVHSELTVTFIGVKQGLATGAALNHWQHIKVCPLDLQTLLQDATPSACYIRLSHALSSLQTRPRDSHKGNYGHVLIVGGNYGMGGAALIAGLSAARSGAGLVSIATRLEHCPAIISRQPELMPHGIHTPDDLTPLLHQASVVVIGPGLGTDDWAQALWKKTVACPLPLIVDASALSLLAQEKQTRPNWMLTPHPGEAASLLDGTSDDIQNNRYHYVNALQTQYHGVAILKGAGTLVQADKQCTQLCADGNPGMASGGMGDALSGILGALVAQGLSLFDAARLGVCVHGTSADIAAKEHGERGLLASDLLPYLQRLLNPHKL